MKLNLVSSGGFATCLALCLGLAQLVGAPLALASDLSTTDEKPAAAVHEELFPPKLPNVQVTTPPATPVLTSPEFEAKVAGSATLKWEAVAGADGYHLQVATDPAFKWLVKNDTLVTEAQASVGELKANVHYYWRVAAVKRGNEATYTKSAFATQMFSTYK